MLRKIRLNHKMILLDETNAVITAPSKQAKSEALRQINFNEKRCGIFFKMLNHNYEFH